MGIFHKREAVPANLALQAWWDKSTLQVKKKKKVNYHFSSRKDKSSKSNSVIFLNATFTLKMCLVCSKQMLLLSLNYVIAYSLLLQLSQETCYTFKTKTHSNSNNIKDINMHVCIPGSCEQGLENWNISSFYRFHTRQCLKLWTRWLRSRKRSERNEERNWFRNENRISNQCSVNKPHLALNHSSIFFSNTAKQQLLII